MQLIKKPKIDLVLRAHKGATRQEVKQKDRYTDEFEIHSCLKEFETANFETRNPKMRFSIPSSTSTLSNTCKVEKPGLAFLQNAKKGLLDFNLRLTENRLQAVTGQATEYCSCPLTPKVGN
jgi:hypothetical protein